MRASGPVYYGWAVLAAAAVCELLAQGATSYGAGLFVLPLQAEFHISRANANLPVAILILGSALLAPLVGRLLDRLPIRAVVAGGAILFAAALAAIALSASLLVMALLLLLPAAAGFLAIGPLTTSTLASRWFFRRRGLALGLAALGTSGGGLVAPLVAIAIARHGWRGGLLIEAAAIGLIVVLLALLVLRDDPAAVGLAQNPENQDRPAAGVAAAPRWTAIMARRAFWIPALTMATVSGICQAIVISLVPYAVAEGMTPRGAALFISVFALSAAVTKVVGGFLADRIPQDRLLAAACAILLLALLLLRLAPGSGVLLAASGMAGVALGCALPATAGVIAASFGSAAFGTVMGWAYALLGLFVIGAVRFVGAMFDRSGGYQGAFTGLAFLAAVILALTLLLPPRKGQGAA